MRETLLTAIGALTIATVLAGCGKSDNAGPAKKDLTQFTIPQSYALVVGTVRDLNNRVLGDVRVETNGQAVATNTQGYFAASRLPEAEHLVVTFQKEGFVPQTKVVHTRIGQNSRIDAFLAPRASETRFEAGQGVTAAHGVAAISIPANALQTPDGELYTGPAKISITPFDPTSDQGMLAFPGKFEGVGADGQVIPFRSLGFVDVTPLTADGRPLQLRPGISADITVPIAQGARANAPDKLPLWFFNPRDGQWHEEGSAVKSGSVYTGKINHFSIWNCDVGYRRAYVIGRVLNCSEDGQPVMGARVSIQNVRAGWTSGEDSTPADGKFRIPVNADEPVDLWAEKGGQKSQHKKFTAPGPDQTYDVGDICLGVPRVQIVLSWGPRPLDLDSHLTVPNGASARGHVFFGHKSDSDTQLDTDATRGFGPEIVTVFKFHDGVYRYSIHHFAGDGNLTGSNAYVHMTIEGLGIFEMTPPQGAQGRGDVWSLWDFEVKNGRVSRLNALATLENGKKAQDSSAFSPH